MEKFSFALYPFVKWKLNGSFSAFDYFVGGEIATGTFSYRFFEVVKEICCRRGYGLFANFSERAIFCRDLLRKCNCTFN